MHITKQGKKIIFSGVQPSGSLHLGNYIGAISQWVKMQQEYDCIFCVVDYHAITVKQNPDELKRRIIEIAKIYLASGIDPKKSIIFQQSDIKEHTELAWILNTIARNSDLTKMTQFKDKSGVQFDNPEFYFANTMKDFSQEMKKIKHTTEINVELPKIITLFVKELFEEYKKILHLFNRVDVGLYDYPVLMAADILLYNTDAVPVGDDQAQHVELARTLARRFNQQFGLTFKVPEVIIRKEGARIMGLDNPAKKMSKSASSEANFIALLDKPEAAARKIMRAVTDSGKEVRYDSKEKPAISNLLAIYSAVSKKTIKELEKEHAGRGYGDFKKGLADEVRNFLFAFQEKYFSISDDEVRQILKGSAERLQPTAFETIKKIKDRLGINIG